MANLSALVVARQWARERGHGQPSWILAGRTAHASIDSAAAVMGCAVLYDGDEHGRLDAAAVDRLFGRVRPGDVVAVVATAGATNTGAVDDLADVAGLCARAGVWLHVDAAYGGGALLSPRCRPLFGGIERADSVTIDPHKWLFTPFDCAAVVYRDALLARRTHAQVAPYLEPVSGESHDNPADYALHLSRRARGIPLWASLLAHGTDAYRTAVEACLELAGYAAERVRGRADLELVGEPSLSVVTFGRAGWAAADYGRWSQHAARAGLGLVTPTTVDGAAALRFCFVNPVTTRADVDRLLDDVARTG